MFFLFCCCCVFLRYLIDKRSDTTKAFKIDPNNGTITVTKALDRETSDWHNLTVEAKETCKDIFKLFTKGSRRCGNLMACLSFLSHEMCSDYVLGEILMKKLSQNDDSLNRCVQYDSCPFSWM